MTTALAREMKDFMSSMVKNLPRNLTSMDIWRNLGDVAGLLDNNTNNNNVPVFQDFIFFSDGTNNLQAHGYIPDSRFAELNVWRTYDDLTVTDIACYLRLNHSRLLTSRLKWRPTLRKDILVSIVYRFC